MENKPIYFNYIEKILKQAFETQSEMIMQIAEKMASTIQDDHLIYVFGAGHAGMIAEEMTYRAGSLVPVVPIYGPGLTLQTRPATLETQIERLSGYAPLLLDASGITSQDMLIIHSNSGRNAVAIDMAEEAQLRGISVIALTSVKHSGSVSSRHPKGYKLMDLADFVIDNCGVIGDAVVPIGNSSSGATSTVVGAALMNALIVETAQILLSLGVEPPLFRSANLDGSSENNQRWMDHYGKRLTYL
ncbi:MAG: SIS domain-containing protein [Anaerolineaceae bacterium]|nr:SIS domain-containing protein [Anaerolineaceae bacterium]